MRNFLINNNNIVLIALTSFDEIFILDEICQQTDFEIED